MVEKAGGRLDQLELEAKGPDNEDLGIDIGWFGPENPERVVLHSSGLHGVEGFAGSAIQLQLLDDLPTMPGDCSLVLVHILNPYGMSWLRRVNENNVDLNRNFMADDVYSGAPKLYGRLDSFLNPQSVPRNDFYLLRAAWLILRYGLPALTQTVAGGQYEYPRGLFFGGKRLQEGLQKYRAFLATRLANAKQIIAIDVHSGLGKYAEDSLFTEATGASYIIRGGLESMLRTVLPQAKIHFTTQEFGTYSPTTVLSALREENRWHHYGDGAVDHPAKQHLKRTFAPEDDSWRISVLNRGREALKRATRL